MCILRDRFRWLLAAVLLLLGTAAAQGEPVGPWSVMSGDGRLVSSTCLGSNATPECLVETAIACDAFSVSPATPDDPYIEHALCKTPGILMGAALWPLRYDHRLVTSYYTFDPWTLTEADLFKHGYGWQPGDLAMDIYLFNCRPEASCRTSFPPGAEPKDILKRCPQVVCTRSGDFDPQTGRRSPAATYILREGENGWLTVDSYSDFMFIFAGTFWEPAHWYRK